MRPFPAILALGAVLALAPGVSAHVTYPTEDGKFLLTVGNQDEPVYTYKYTGLDLIIRENTTARTEVPGVNATLNATLLGPGGEELTTPLALQHGAKGRYQFTHGYVLTQPGIYKLRLVGTVNGSSVDGTYNMPHEITAGSEIMFPDRGVATLKELHGRLAQVEFELEELRNEHRTEEESNAAPLGTPVLAVLAILASALAARRRAEGA